MKLYFKKSLVILLVISFVFVLAACGSDNQDKNETSKQEQENEKIKVGLILPGNVNDKGWNASAYEGLNMAKENYDIETSYMESVPQSDFEEAFRNYAANGYDLVIGHGYQFQDAVKKVAPNFPDTKFAILNGGVSEEPNLASFQFTNWQPGYVTGVLAGLLTESNVIGAIGAYEIPVISDALEAFRDGAQSVNPEAKILLTYVESWTDVAKGKETALAMIENGADVVVCDANAVGLGSIEACQEKGVYAIGFVDDQYSVAPETVVASGIQSNQLMVLRIIEKFLNNEFEPKVYQMGLAEGVEGISPFYDWVDKLPKDIIEKVKQVEKDIIDGKIKWSKQ